jgi:hypothetical protein
MPFCSLFAFNLLFLKRRLTLLAKINSRKIHATNMATLRIVSDKRKAGRKYIAYDWSEVDRANRQVIDYMMSD